MSKVKVVKEQTMTPGSQLPPNGVPSTANMVKANNANQEQLKKKKFVDIQKRISAITNNAQTKTANINKSTQNQINNLNRQLQKMNEEENQLSSKFFLGRVGLILKNIVMGNYSVILSKEDKELAGLLNKDMYAKDIISKIKEELKKEEPNEEMLKVLKMKINSRISQLYKEGKTNVRI